MVVEAAIDVNHCALRAWTGSVEISVFQTLSAGKTWQLVFGTGAAAAGTVLDSVDASEDDARMAMPRRVVRMQYE